MHQRQWALTALCILFVASLPLLAFGQDGLEPGASETGAEEVGFEQVPLGFLVLQDTVRPSEEGVWTRVLLDLGVTEGTQYRTLAQVAVSPEQLDELAQVGAEDNEYLRKWVEEHVGKPLLRQLAGARSYLPQEEFLIALAGQVNKHGLGLYISFGDDKQPKGQILFNGVRGAAEAGPALFASLNGLEILLVQGTTLTRPTYDVEVWAKQSAAKQLGTAQNGHLFIPAEDIPRGTLQFMFTAPASQEAGFDLVAPKKPFAYDPLVSSSGAKRELVVCQLPPFPPAARGESLFKAEALPTREHLQELFMKPLESLGLAGVGSLLLSDLAVDAGWATSTTGVSGAFYAFCIPLGGTRLGPEYVAPAGLTVELRTSTVGSNVQYPYLHVVAHARASARDLDVTRRDPRFQLSVGLAPSAGNAKTVGLSYRPLPLYALRLHVSAVTGSDQGARGAIFGVTVEPERFLKRLFGR